MNCSHMLKDTVTIKSASGLDDAGQKTYGSASTIKARVQRGTKFLKRADGNELVSDAQFYTDTEVTWDMLIWLPGDDTTKNGRKPKVLRKATQGMGGNYTLYEVWI